MIAGKNLLLALVLFPFAIGVAGCGGSSGGLPPPNQTIFVAVPFQSTVAKFSTGDNGDVAPFGSIAGANTTLSFPRAVAIEPDAQLSNGFGAMVHSRVTCAYDLRAKRVLSVDVAPR